MHLFVVIIFLGLIHHWKPEVLLLIHQFQYDPLGPAFPGPSSFLALWNSCSFPEPLVLGTGDLHVQTLVMLNWHWTPLDWVLGYLCKTGPLSLPIPTCLTLLASSRSYSVSLVLVQSLCAFVWSGPDSWKD